jgi:hypothetical protein
MRNFFTIFALLLALSSPALAQQGEGGSLSYTTLGARKERPQGRTGGHMNYKALKYNGTLEKSGSSKPEEEKNPEDEKAADEVWEKYKALAAGQYEEPAKESKPKPASKHIETDEEKPAVGLAGIIEQYNKNKTQRSQMRTIRMKPPEEERHLEPVKKTETEPAKEENEPDEDEQKSGG